MPHLSRRRKNSTGGGLDLHQTPEHGTTVDRMADTPLPEPESERLAALVGQGSLRLTYGLLYRRRSHPPTEKEITFFLQTASAETPFGQLIRSLREYFDVAATPLDGEVRYQLTGWAGTRSKSEQVPISPRLRVQALARGRCSLCGKAPGQHGVVLEVDLRVPPEWGGTNDPENLWALCETCHVGWLQHLQTYAPYADKISRAASYAEPQRRIGELLKAFDGGWVPSELIGIVASAKEYQEDFQRRIRDLRFLGWDIKQQKRYNEGARVRSYYRLVRSAPWPDSIRTAIATEERARKAKKQASSASSTQ